VFAASRLSRNREASPWKQKAGRTEVSVARDVSPRDRPLLVSTHTKLTLGGDDSPRMIALPIHLEFQANWNSPLVYSHVIARLMPTFIQPELG
jgi:hypothetical protein